MKNLLTILILFAISLTANAQEEQDNGNLRFGLKLENTHDVNTDKILVGAEVKIIGTDGSSRIFTTDSLGEVQFIEIKLNTSYSLVVSKIGYLNAKGKESSVGEVKSKMYVHEYALQPACNLSCPRYPDINYTKNNLTPTINKGFDNYEWMYNIMSDNPTIIFEVVGYREGSEKEGMSLKRAQDYVNKVSEMGIEKERFKVTDGGVRDYKPSDNKLDTRELSKKELRQENRTITFKIIGDDYGVLEFTLDIVVKDVETLELLPCATITIIGTDGSSRTFTPSEQEPLGPISLDPETSYSIVIELKKYLNAKGKVTTVGLTQSKKFLHEYTIQPFMDSKIILPLIEFDHNKFKVLGTMHDSLYYMNSIMKDNPTLIVEVWGFQDSTEKEGVSLLRAEAVKKELVQLGIATGRLVVVDYGMELYVITEEIYHSCKPTRTLIKGEKEFSGVIFMVIADDYVPSE